MSAISIEKYFLIPNSVQRYIIKYPRQIFLNFCLPFRVYIFALFSNIVSFDTLKDIRYVDIW